MRRRGQHNSQKTCFLRVSLCESRQRTRIILKAKNNRLTRLKELQFQISCAYSDDHERKSEIAHARLLNRISYRPMIRVKTDYVYFLIPWSKQKIFLERV